jgi:hypothetical protein
MMALSVLQWKDKEESQCHQGRIDRHRKKRVQGDRWRRKMSNSRKQPGVIGLVDTAMSLSKILLSPVLSLKERERVG